MGGFKLKRKFFVLCLVIFLIVMTAGCAPDQQTTSESTYPESPIEIIVSGSAGGGTDLTARTFAPALEKELGVPVAVVNEPGSGGVKAFSMMATAEPNGYTIGLVTLPAMTLAAVNGDLKVDPNSDYIYLGQVVYNPSTVAVSASSKFDTLDEVVDHLKENPESLTMAATGPGTLKALIATGLEKQAGVKFRIVSFQGGSDCITQAIGGHVDLTGATVAEALPFVSSGDLRVLAVAGDERNPKLPDVPTFTELGYNLPIQGATHGFVVPKGTDEKVVAILRSAIENIAKDKEFAVQAEKSGMDLLYKDSESLAKQVEQLMIDLKEMS
jgi:tripartite-type tricarboxylate transporter receptor subunit TctC